MAQRHPQAEDALIEFRWDVPENGLQIVRPASEKPLITDRKKPGSGEREMRPESRGRSDLFLVERTPVGLDVKVRRYNPLVFNPIAKQDPKIQDHQPRLFHNFCELEPSQEKILGFVNQCGLLVGTYLVVPKGRKRVFTGEPLSLWWREVADMKLAFDLWTAVLEGNGALLKEHIRFFKTDGGLVVRCGRGVPRGGKGTSHAFFTVVDATTGMTDRSRLLKEGDFRLAAVFAIQDLVRKRLLEHVAASVLYVPERDGFAGGSRPVGPAREKRLPLGLRMVPQNLLGALWLQLAQEIERGTEYRRCAMCSKRMEISLEGHRRNRRTCSDKCRRALQRKREDDARVLRAQGKSLRQIAEEFGTTVAHVRAWTAKPKRLRGRPRKGQP